MRSWQALPQKAACRQPLHFLMDTPGVPAVTPQQAQQAVGASAGSSPLLRWPKTRCGPVARRCSLLQSKGRSCRCQGRHAGGGGGGEASKQVGCQRPGHIQYASGRERCCCHRCWPSCRLLPASQRVRVARPLHPLPAHLLEGSTWQHPPSKGPVKSGGRAAQCAASGGRWPSAAGAPAACSMRSMGKHGRHQTCGCSPAAGAGSGRQNRSMSQQRQQRQRSGSSSSNSSGSSGSSGSSSSSSSAACVCPPAHPPLQGLLRRGREGVGGINPLPPHLRDHFGPSVLRQSHEQAQQVDFDVFVNLRRGARATLTRSQIPRWLQPPASSSPGAGACLADNDAMLRWTRCPCWCVLRPDTHVPRLTLGMALAMTRCRPASVTSRRTTSPPRLHIAISMKLACTHCGRTSVKGWGGLHEGRQPTSDACGRGSREPGELVCAAGSLSNADVAGMTEGEQTGDWSQRDRPSKQAQSCTAAVELPPGPTWRSSALHGDCCGCSPKAAGMASISCVAAWASCGAEGEAGREAGPGGSCTPASPAQAMRCTCRASAPRARVASYARWFHPAPPAPANASQRACTG